MANNMRRNTDYSGCHYFDYLNFPVVKMIKKDQDSYFAREGLLAIKAEVMTPGNDIFIFLSGGEEHIGCLVLAQQGKETQILQLAEHKEAVVAVPMAEICAKVLHRTVAICAGIHFPHLSQEEIQKIIELCKLLTDRIIADFKADEN